MCKQTDGRIKREGVVWQTMVAAQGVVALAPTTQDEGGWLLVAGDEDADVMQCDTVGLLHLRAKEPSKST